MTVRVSTGLRNAMLGTSGLKTALANGVLRLYSGAQPASADSAASGTLLAEITLDGGAFAHGSPTNGLNMDTPADGAISKPSGDVWTGLGLVAGTTGWARFCGNPTDDAGASTTLSRIDYSVGKTTGDIHVSNINVEVGVPVGVDVATMSFPASA